MDLQEFWLYFPQTQLPRGVRAQLIGPKPFDVQVWKWCEDVEQVCSSVTTSVKPFQSATIVDILPNCKWTIKPKSTLARWIPLDSNFYSVTVLKGCGGSESSLFILLDKGV